MLSDRFIEDLISVGTLKVIDAEGGQHVFAATPEPCVAARLHDKKLPRRLLVSPQLHLGEAYMDGTLTMEEGTIYDLLALLTRNAAVAKPGKWRRFLDGLVGLRQTVQQYNPVARARANAAHHYDLSDEIFDTFLDANRQYSCAYFRGKGESLETAQANKMRHIATKLLIEPGMKVLDIGSGWGGLALWLGQVYGADVTGITLSERQLTYAARRAEETGLSDRVRFFLRDYREERGTFDRIVSVGMFEHVGAPHYRTFFTKLRSLMNKDGVAVLHSIGQSRGPDVINPWIRKHIFPGACIPALSEVTRAIERTGLWITDVEILRLHYADTLREWRRRFLARRDGIAQIRDERFCRMWEYYLAVSEAAFRYGGMMVFQAQLARRQDAVPLTRDYMVDGDRVPASAAAAQ
jgi:cyclopropane-fatty-acyl-phospholipid synthase